MLPASDWLPDGTQRLQDGHLLAVCQDKTAGRAFKESIALRRHLTVVHRFSARKARAASARAACSFCPLFRRHLNTDFGKTVAKRVYVVAGNVL